MNPCRTCAWFVQFRGKALCYRLGRLEPCDGEARQTCWEPEDRLPESEGR